MRRVILGLMSPSQAALKTIGLSASAFKDAHGNLLPLSKDMEILNEHTKDLSTTQKGAVFKALFGTTGMNAGEILATSSSQLANLTSKVEHAGKTGKYVSDLANKNMQSAKNQIKILQQNFENLGMTLALKVLPDIQPIIKDATKMVQWFGQLNPAIQQNIVKWVALAAAIGPVLSIGSRVLLLLGKFNTGTIGLIAKLAGWNAKVNATKNVMGQLTDTSGNTIGVLQKVGSSAGTSAGFFKTLASKMTVAEGETGVLGSSFGPLGVGLMAVTAAVGIGAIAWEGWGKHAYAAAQKAYEAQQRTDRWGTSINASADKAASGFMKLEQNATIALNNTSGSAKSNAKAIGTAFKSMLTAAEKNITKAEKDTATAVKEIGGSIGKDVEKQAEKALKNRKNALQDMKQLYTQAKAITDDAENHNKAITADQKVTLENLQQEMANDWVKTLNVSESKQKQILKVIKGDYKTLSAAQLKSVSDSLGKKLAQNAKQESQALSRIKSQHDQGLISDAKYYSDSAKLRDRYYSENKSAMIADFRATVAWNHKQANYQSLTAEQKKQYNAAMIKDQQDYLTKTLGLTKAQAQAIIQAGEQQQKSAKSTVISLDGLGKKATSEAKMWNSLVFDPKTGKLKTNAQEEVNKAVISGKKWGQIRLLVKNGKMTTNGTQMIAKALISKGEWDKLKFVAKNAKLNDETKSAIASALVSANQWNTKDWKAAKLLAQDKTDSAVISALQHLGLWQKLSPKVQKMISQDKTGAAVESALKHMGMWNRLPDKVKNLVSADKTTYTVRKAISAINAWNAKTAKTITMTTVYRSLYETGHKNSSAAMRSTFQMTGPNPYNARGTHDWRGGLAVVNDQRGQVFREAVVHPNGMAEIPMGRRVVMNLERHSQVIPARMTEKFFGKLPQFASGTIPANSGILDFARNVTERVTNSRNQDQSSQVVKAINKNSLLLQAMINLITPKMTESDPEINVNLNQIMRAFATRLEPYLAQNMIHDQTRR